MLFLINLKEAEFKENSWVKTFVRNGRIVRSHNRQVEKSNKNNTKRNLAIAGTIGIGGLVTLGLAKKSFKNINNLKNNANAVVSSVKLLTPMKTAAKLQVVVKSSTAYKYRNGQSLNISDMENIIDDASYFKSTNAFNNLKNKTSKAPNKEILPDSVADVFMEIEIDDGENIINEKIPYIIKRNLSPNSTFIVKDRSVLQNLNGIEDFNRI